MLSLYSQVQTGNYFSFGDFLVFHLNLEKISRHLNSNTTHTHTKHTARNRDFFFFCYIIFCRSGRVWCVSTSTSNVRIKYANTNTTNSASFIILLSFTDKQVQFKMFSWLENVYYLFWWLFFLLFFYLFQLIIFFIELKSGQDELEEISMISNGLQIFSNELEIIFQGDTEQRFLNISNGFPY